MSNDESVPRYAIPKLVSKADTGGIEIAVDGPYAVTLLLLVAVIASVSISVIIGEWRLRSVRDDVNALKGVRTDVERAAPAIVQRFNILETACAQLIRDTQASAKTLAAQQQHTDAAIGYYLGSNKWQRMKAATSESSK